MAIKDVTDAANRRRDLKRLLDEQAALRRVATRVASTDEPASVFALVAQEAASLLGIEGGAVARFTEDRAEMVGHWVASGVVSDGRPPFGDLRLDGSSAVARVAASGRAARTVSYTGDEPATRRLNELGMRAGVAAPVRVNGRLWGAVAGATRDPARLKGNAEERLGRFAQLVEMALQNTEDRRSLRLLAREQASIGRIATMALGDDDLATLLSTAAGEATRLVGGTAGAVLRVTDGGRARWVAGWSPEGTLDHLAHGGARLPWRPADAGAHEGLVVRIDDSQVESGPAAIVCDSAGMRSCLVVPVRAGDRPWGVLLVMGEPAGAFDDGDTRRVAKLGEVLSLVVAGAQARDELASRALQDPLTGLANHRAFFRRLDEQIVRARRHDENLTLVMLDLDRFKHINDTRGHQAGDAALAAVADAISACARAGELVGRIGGDEFAWILPGADMDGARVAAERARNAVRSITIAGVGRLSLSVGIAEMGQARDMAGLMRLADGALYHAKAEGRDRVVCYAPDVVTDFSAEERADHVLRDQAMSGLRALARAVDAKDPDTREHSERVGRLAALIARARGWDAEAAEHLREAALVHDVGKIGVPDSVLFSPRPLTPDEYDIVKGHVVLSADIADEVLAPDQVAWVRGHHERWDGAGYPDRLAGDDIPEGARILALADAWDVMCAVRAYKQRMSVTEALAECRRVAGGQFDPSLVMLLGRLWMAGMLDQLWAEDGFGTATRHRVSVVDTDEVDTGDEGGFARRHTHVTLGAGPRGWLRGPSSA